MVTTATICRLKNVSKRLLKVKYSHLSPHEKRYIKMIEQKDSLSRDIGGFWQHATRNKHGKATQDNDWDFYHYVDGELTKVKAQIDRLLAKTGWGEADIANIRKIHAEYNRSPGGSF